MISLRDNGTKASEHKLAKRRPVLIPEDFRLAVYLADVEGFSYQEVADIMKTPVGTVMSRLHRGRRLLRELLADYARDRGYAATTPTPRSTR